MTLTEEQAIALEKRAQLVEEFRDQPSDPNAPPPPKGGEIALSPPGEQTFVEQIAVAAGGAVGGYNGFWLDPGNKVIRIDGVAAQLHHHRSARRPHPRDDRRRQTAHGGTHWPS